MGPHPAVAQVRLAVRRCLSGTGLAPGDLLLVACSGGADSLALASALAFEAPKSGLRAGGVTVDHGLQDGSDEQARRVTKALQGMDLRPVDSATAAVARPGGPGYPGPEAAAREARYAALRQAASARGAAAVLLGHTMDDQAETVLLGWRVAPALARWPGCPSAPAPSCARCCGSAAPRPGPPAPPRASSRGTTRRTPTPASPACGSGTGCSRCSRRSSGPALPKRWPAVPGCCALTPISLTRSRRASWNA